MVLAFLADFLDLIADFGDFGSSIGSANLTDFLFCTAICSSTCSYCLISFSSWRLCRTWDSTSVKMRTVKSGDTYVRRLDGVSALSKWSTNLNKDDCVDMKRF